MCQWHTIILHRYRSRALSRVMIRSTNEDFCRSVLQADREITLDLLTTLK